MMQATSTTDRRPELDGLRALAIIAVFLAHYFACMPVPGAYWLLSMGWAGVDLFFVLSGFLIGGILLDNREKPRYYSTFYIRRFFRIVPVYLLVIAPLFAAEALGLRQRLMAHASSHEAGFPLWFYLLFLQNIGAAIWGWGVMQSSLSPTWSLAVEEQFYLLLPPVVRHVKPARLPVILIAAIVSAPLIRGVLIWLFAEKAEKACYMLLPCRWDALLLGVLCAWCVRTEHWKQQLTTHLGALRAALVLLAAGVLTVKLFPGMDGNGRLLSTIGFTWNDLFFTALLLLAYLNTKGLVGRLLSWPALKPVATISYAVYLFHIPVLELTQRLAFRQPVQKYGWTEIAVACLALLVTGVLTFLSWRFFESKMVRLGHHFTYSRNG